jgi:hypothetical protein
VDLRINVSAQYLVNTTVLVSGFREGGALVLLGGGIGSPSPEISLPED